VTTSSEHPRTVLADPTKWSEESRRSVAVEFIKKYEDIAYDCWRCRKPAVFSAEDQKYTFEIKKANINQRRVLCPECWKESLIIAAALEDREERWVKEKNVLTHDKAFLTEWLSLLTRREEFIPYKPDTARKNMLARLLQNV